MSRTSTRKWRDSSESSSLYLEILSGAVKELERVRELERVMKRRAGLENSPSY